MSACGQSGFEPKVAFTDERIENLIGLVSQGMGVSLLMKPLALYGYNQKIAIVDITPNVTTEISLCYLKAVKLTEAAKHFIQCAETLRPDLNSGDG
jgi:DNA-binding transcriptional LysR family regulator